MQTNVTALVREHCARQGIRITPLPSGAVRFTGWNVSLLVAAFQPVRLEDLEPYDPRKGRALDNI